jgi:transposase InsO family protein
LNDCLPDDSETIQDVEAAANAEEVLPQAIQTEDLILEQARDKECKDFAAFKAKQIVVPASMRPKLLHLEHCPQTAGHPGSTRMFRSMRRRFFWPKMAQDVAETVRQCAMCAKNRIKERARTSFLKLFPASEPLEYVSMVILCPLPKTQHGNRFLLVITDRFSKLTRTVPLRTISALAVAKAFCEAWIFAYGPPCYLLTENGAQFAAKFFLAVCRELGIAKVFTTAYYPQTNGQVERFNRTILDALRNYVRERQGSWDEYTTALTFSYNCRIHSSLGLTPFELVLTRPPVSISVEQSPPDREPEDTASAKLRFLQQIKELCPVSRQRLADDQARYKRNFDNSIREKNMDLAPGDWVFFKREVHREEDSPKLASQADGPFRVVETTGHTLVIQKGEEKVRVSSDRVTRAPPPAPTEGTIHPEGVDVRVDSGLETRNDTPVVDGTTARDTPRRDMDYEVTGAPLNEEEYVIERLRGAKQLPDGSYMYLVKWYGYSADESTWEPGKTLPEEMVRRHHKRTELPYPPLHLRTN